MKIMAEACPGAVACRCRRASTRRVRRSAIRTGALSAKGDADATDGPAFGARRRGESGSFGKARRCLQPGARRSRSASVVPLRGHLEPVWYCGKLAVCGASRAAAIRRDRCRRACLLLAGAAFARWASSATRVNGQVDHPEADGGLSVPGAFSGARERGAQDRFHDGSASPALLVRRRALRRRGRSKHQHRCGLRPRASLASPRCQLPTTDDGI
jgi:hypothetical protein